MDNNFIKSHAPLYTAYLFNASLQVVILPRQYLQYWFYALQGTARLRWALAFWGHNIHSTVIHLAVLRLSVTQS